MSLAYFQSLVDRMVRAPANTIDDTDRDDAIELARVRYSADCERRLVEDVTWVADGYFGPAPASWADGAYLLGAEYPIGEVPAASIDLEVSIAPDMVVQVVTPNALQAGDIVRVSFAAPHLLEGEGEDAQDTIPEKHREALANYAAHQLFKQLAARYSNDRDSAVAGDRADTESRARNYAIRAKEARAAYYAGIGMADPLSDKPGASVVTGEGAGAVTSWPGRSRNSLTRGVL